MILLCTGSKGTEVFWQTSAGAGDLGLLFSLVISAVPFRASAWQSLTWPWSRSGSEVSRTFFCCALLIGFEMSTYYHKCYPACFLMPTTALKHMQAAVLLCSSTFRKKRSSAIGWRGVIGSVSFSSSSLLLFLGAVWSSAGSTLPIHRKNWRWDKKAEQHTGIFL